MTATTSTQDKIDFVLKMPNGATHAVNYKTQDFFEETQKITNKKGVDVIIDFVGRSHWHKNIAAFARDGRMTLLATLSGASPRCSDSAGRKFHTLLSREQGGRGGSRSHPLQAPAHRGFDPSQPFR